MTQSIQSAGVENDDILFEDELRALSEERKAQLLHYAGITINRSKGLPLSPCLVSLGIG